MVERLKNRFSLSVLSAVSGRLIFNMEGHAVFCLCDPGILLDLGRGFVDGRAILTMPSYHFTVFQADAFPLRQFAAAYRSGYIDDVVRVL